MSCNSLTVGASAWLQGFQAAPRYNLASFRVLRLPNHWLVSELQRRSAQACCCLQALLHANILQYN